MTGQTIGNPEIETQLADYISRAVHAPLPSKVVEKARAHLLDTLAAMVSGASLAAGRQARRFIKDTGPPGPCTIAGSKIGTSAINAAFANAMSAHADETDDSHLAGKFHPGCSIVPTALALSESRGLDGSKLLRAVALGYDIGARFTQALGMKTPRSWTHSTHCLGGNFGATATAGTLVGLTHQQCIWLLSYAVQQASGLAIWHRDGDHVQKAFDFGGMAARNAVFAAEFIESGATGVSDPISGEHGYLSAFAENAAPDALTRGLGTEHAILSASIKKWCVGSPIQAALDALAILIDERDLAANSVEQMTITLPDDRIKIVDNRDMPDVCVQHCLAVLLLDRALPFASAHDKSRMSDPEVLALRERIVTIASPELTVARPARQAIVEIETKSGEVLRHHTRAVSGTPENPMEWPDVRAKSHALMVPTLGPHATEQLIEIVRKLDENTMVRDIGTLIRGAFA